MKLKLHSVFSLITQRFAVIFIVALLAISSSFAGIPALNLRSLDNFVIIAGSTITGIPPVSIKGNIGLSPAAGSYITGFDGSNVDGILYVVDASGPTGSVVNATLLQTAKSDLTTAYNDAANRTPVPTGTFLNPGAGNIGGMNLAPGLYKFTGAAGITGADVTLTGSATDVWIFQIGSSLNLGSGIKVILAGGAQAANIFWQVGTSATLGTYSVFKGTILADQSISLGTGASMDGRALAFEAAVTMSSGVTSTKAFLKPFFSVDSLSLTFGNVNIGANKKDTVTVTNTGGADLIITSVTSSNSVFTVTPTTGTITPGSTQKYVITFTPNANGSQTANIIFNHNAEKPKDTITVSGNGTSPKFTASPMTINFGNVRNGQTKRDSVTVTNTGTADLIISSITIANTLFTITPTTGTIIPNGTKKFYITFAPLIDGAQTGNVIFNHNAVKPKDTITVSGSGVSAKFSPSPLTLNFGNVQNGSTKRDSITVTNTGTADLIISSITSSNGLFTVTPLNGTIVPGSTQKYYVTFAPIADGVQTGLIIFNHNASKPKDTITVTGTGVSPKFSVNPTNLIFGNVAIGTSKRDSVTVTNTGTANLIITSITSSNGLFTVTPLNGTITPGSTQKYYISFAPLADGSQAGMIIFNHNATKPKDTVTVSGTGVSPKFTVNPTTLNFGNVPISLNKRDSVTVTNTGTANLIITSVTTSNGLFTVSPALGTITPGSSQKFYITFAPLADGLQNGMIIFNHNATKTKDTVIVSGTGTSPRFTVSPTSLNFGKVRNGLSKVDSVSVTNTGTANLIISSVSSSNPLFTVTPTFGVITPGSTLKFYGTFAPLADGLQTGTFIFNHNAPKPKDTVTLSGTGVSPKFSVSPLSLNFGNVINGTTKTDSIVITNTGTADLVISSFVSTNSRYSINVLNATIAAGSSQKFYISFTPLVSQFEDGYIRFMFNATNAKDSIHVTGTGVGVPVFPLFSVNPTSLDFGNVASGSTKEDFVTVTNLGTANLIVFSVTSGNAIYYANPGTGVITPGASQKFYITFAPLSPGFQAGYVYFNHNAANAKDSIRVTGTGTGNDIAPKFTVNTNNLDFGNVYIGSTKQKSVFVTNTGSSNLLISDITSNNPLYSITPIVGTIAPNSTQEFFITFAPIVIGQTNGVVLFTHNVGNNVVNVTGRGVDSIHVITIKAARELPIGTDFIIEGVITRSLGSYSRIQDQTGGLTLFQESGSFFDVIENSIIVMGDKVRIEGKISEKDNLKVINGIDLIGFQKISSSNQLPTPIKVTLAQISSNGELYESCLIRVENLTITTDGDLVYQPAKTYQISDASDKTNTVVVHIGNSADTYMDGMQIMGTSATFEGVLSQSSACVSCGYQLTPVLSTDLSTQPNGVADATSTSGYTLSDNYPNPFTASTTIQYSIPSSGFVTLKVFNLSGKEVATLVNSFQNAGTYTAAFSIDNSIQSIGSEMYFYRLQVGSFISSKQMISVQ